MRSDISRNATAGTRTAEIIAAVKSRPPPLYVRVCLQVASDPRVNFVGNVCLGSDVSAAQLSELYDVVVLAYGAAGDRELAVPGAHLKGVFAARAFVSW